MKILPTAVLLALLALPSPARAAEPAAWEPAAVVDGAPYHKVEELRSFYKLTPNSKSARKGAVSMGNSGVNLELGPGLRELSIGGLQLTLARPLQKDASGSWLISREDWVCLVDPILRPTYIPTREAVHTVILDPGHGGHDAGETTPQLRECAVALQVARKLKAELEKRGYKVQLTRDEDVFLSDRQRVTMANAVGEGSIFLSLHLNSGRSDFRGTSVYTLAPGQDARPGHACQQAHAALAYALQSALVSQAGAADAGQKHAHYSLLSSIRRPAVWVELGYATHAQEGSALLSPAYQDALAQALAQGVAAYAHATNPATSIPVQEPTTPAKPATPAKATTPAKPATPAKATIPAKPATPAKGTTPAKPTTPAKGSTTAKSTTPAKGSTTAKSTTPAKSATAKPATTAKGSSTAKPATTAKSATDTKPASTGKKSRR